MTGARLALATALWAGAAFSQTAQLSGLIQDPSSLKVSNAEITVRNEQTGGKRLTRSNESGFYSVFSLSPGIYRVSVHAGGFETIVRDGIQLEVGENARIDFSLRIGDSRTEVTVHGGPPLMNTEDASVGTVIDRGIIDQMPLNGRGIQSLIELTPGVVVVPVVDASRGQFAVNGQRSDANYFTVDGVSANFGAGDTLIAAGITGGRRSSLGQAGGGMLPANNFLGTFSNLVSPDALQEFKIQTSTFAPEYGRSPGAQIEFITRSGGNRYSASLFEYFRNDKLDANDWFANQQALTRPPLRLNNFGGTFSGPVRLPHFYNGRDRTFFFLSMESLLSTQPQSATVVPVPTLEARQNAPPLVAALLSAFPLPNRPAAPDNDPAVSGFSQFAGSYSLRQSQQTYGLRLDHSFSNRLVLFARYNRAPSHRLEPLAALSLPSNIEKYEIGAEMLTLGLTRTFTPNLVNEVRLNASRQSAKVSEGIGEIAGAISPPDSLIFPAGYSSADSQCLVSLPLTPGFSVGFDSTDRARQLNFVDRISYIRGAHQLKFGADYRWFSPQQVRPRSLTLLLFDGLYGARGAYSGIVPDVDVVVPGVTQATYVLTAVSTYAQDTWKVNRRLSLTYGVRWEVAPAPRISSGQTGILAGLSNLSDASTAHLVPPGAPFYPTTWANFAPRFGLGWRIFDAPAAKTVLRAGAGRFFDLAQAGFQDSAALIFTVPQFVNQPLGSIGAGTPDRVGNIVNTTNVAAAPGYGAPVTYQWNVTLEQALGGQTFSASYVGALGRRLIGYLRLPDPGPYSQVDVLGNSGRSAYHAMQLQFNRRVSTRVRMLLSYTWSHSIDTLSNDLEGVDVTIRSLPQYDNPGINRGPSEFDIRHSLNGAIMAALPSPRQRAAQVLFRSWYANTIFFARSALPTDILSSDRIERADLVAGQPLYLYGSGYPGGKRYNDAAFADSVPGVQGSLGRNALRGFGAWQIDLGLNRSFRLAERTSLQFRAEAFNVLNHPNFTNPGDDGDPGHLTLTHDSNFGISTTMLANGLGSLGVPGQLHPLFQIGGPRSLQFALRLAF